ncbi:MAG: hypothetical protein HOV80_13295 [Polyangiaceae bacterium]|nr:hypothetical protein [Polyangiaceae bacterium]
MASLFGQRTSFAVVALAASLATTGAAAAERSEPRVEITYGAGTASCPDAASIHAQIAKESSGAATSNASGLEIIVEQARGEYVATVRQGLRVRVFRSPTCSVVTHAAAWVAALALVEEADAALPDIDAAESPPPKLEIAPSQPAPPTPPALSTIASPAVRDAAQRPVAAREVEALVAIGAVVGGGYVPNTWPGVSVAVGARGAYWSMAVEGRYFPRSPIDVPELADRLYVSTGAASLVPCGRYSILRELAVSGCGMMTAGATFGEAPAVLFAPAAEPIFLLGARTGIEARPHERFAIGMTGTLEVALLDTPIDGFLGDTPKSFWTAPLFAGAGGVESIVTF